MRPRDALKLVWIFVCLATLFKGAQLVAFSLNIDRVETALAKASEGGSDQTDPALETLVVRWKDQPGAADLARILASELVRPERPDDNGAAEGAISDVVANSPTYDQAWLDLAELRYARGEAMANVLAAFRMSDLTGSHEGQTMVQRAVFGIEHWSILPKSDQQIAVRDILGTIDSYFKPQDRYREILAKRPDPERADIRAALIASGRVDTTVLQALGL